MIKIEYVQPSKENEVITVVFLDTERNLRGVKIISHRLAESDNVYCQLSYKDEEWQFPEPKDVDFGVFPEGAELVNVEVEISWDMKKKLEEWCKVTQVSEEMLLRAIILFWVAPENREIVDKWAKEWKIMEWKKTGLGTLKTVTSEEFLADFDALIDEVTSGQSPLCIWHKGDEFLLFGWEDYRRRFSICFPEGEKERIEMLCAEQAAAEEESTPPPEKESDQKKKEDL